MAPNPNHPPARGAPLPSRSVSGPLPQSLPPRGSAPEVPARRRVVSTVARSNAIRRAAGPDGPTLELKDIEINGDLVTRALGLSPTPPPTPRIADQVPPMRPSDIDYNTLPLPRIPQASSSSRRHGMLFLAPSFSLPPLPQASSSSRRNGMLILAPDDLPDELRNIKLDDEMTENDPT
ncbi:hypothetical protein PGT21_029906 [Puccinia graminis f. sp. tritici]|uniref:Uncharacterized protein n=1 Tax=Puccinia graminis f. sp. tritici TaxID=56615 RepID=A0A5B0SN19_PUCGR|nr:hypothetical protein PGT21_029906 [Puccinia graminis f. sp. tritici]KAA1139241.1 hypothetical protein PGTUg99_037509 [Puccinia graminis f. sp. tritici]